MPSRYNDEASHIQLQRNYIYTIQTYTNWSTGERCFHVWFFLAWFMAAWYARIFVRNIHKGITDISEKMLNSTDENSLRPNKLRRQPIMKPNTKRSFNAFDMSSLYVFSPLSVSSSSSTKSPQGTKKGQKWKLLLSLQISGDYSWSDEYQVELKRLHENNIDGRCDHPKE